MAPCPTYNDLVQVATKALVEGDLTTYAREDSDVIDGSLSETVAVVVTAILEALGDTGMI